MTNSQKSGLICWLFSCLLFAAVMIALPPITLKSMIITCIMLIILGVVWPILWLRAGRKPTWIGI